MGTIRSAPLTVSRPARRPTRPLGEAWLRLLGIASFLLIWEFLGGSGLVDPLFISRPSLVFRYVVTGILNGRLTAHFLASMYEFSLAWSLAALVGVVLGVTIGLYRLLGETLEGLLWFFTTAPIVVLYPLLMMWLGLGFPTVVAIAFLIAVFPIIFNTMLAVRGADPVLIRCARSFGATSWELVTRVILPDAVPLIVAGLRVAVGPAMIGVILGELFGADRGLGFLVADHGRRLQTTGMFGALVLSTVFSLVVTTLLMLAESRLTRWRTVGAK